MGERIDRLVLRHFRGATTTTEIRLDPRQPIVVLYGENGSGKSTLVDAIDLVCNQAYGSLADRSTVSPREHLSSAGYRPSDIAVELSCADAAWQAAYDGRAVKVTGPEPRPAVYILRRRKMLRLVDETPSGRYEALRHFIDVEGVEKSEMALQKAANAAKARHEEAVRRRREVEEELTELWTREGCPGAPGQTAVQWAKEKAGADTSALQEEIARLRTLNECFTAAGAAAAELDNAEAEQRLKEGERGKVEEEIERAPEPAPRAGIELIQLLRQAQSYLQAPEDSGSCPVCRQPAAAADLRQQIADRLAASSRQIEWIERREAAVRAVDSSAARVGECRARLIAAARRLAREAHRPGIPLIDRLVIPWERCAALLTDEEDPEAGRAAAESLLDRLAPIREELGARCDELQADLSRHNALELAYQRGRKSSQEARRAHDVHQRLSRGLGIVREERLAFTGRVLEGVSSECNRLYTRIHPGEPLGDLHLYLDERRRGSLLQGARFGEQPDVPPQAYFSESHLDTLGLCVFLAVTRLFSQGNAILVLDDCFTSVDTAHLERIAGLLVEESAGFDQILITTHFPQWRDRIAAMDPRHTQVIELAPWTPEHGITVSR